MKPSACFLRSRGVAVSTASRRSMPVGDRRSVRAFSRLGGTRFRPPLDGRCRSETGAPFALLRSWGYAVSTASRRSMPVGDRRSVRVFAQLGVREFRPPRGGRCRSETGAPFARFCSVGGTRVSTASWRSMPVGDRRSVRALLRSWGYASFDRLSAVDAGRRPALRSLHPVLRGHSSLRRSSSRHPPSIVRASVPIPNPR